MGLSGGYSLHIQDQENDYLGVVVVEEKSSDAIDAAYERWTNSLEGDLTPQVMTDHGTEFQGKFGACLAEREAYNPLTPVGSHHSLGKNERSHREWLTILRGILYDRGLDDSHWRDFASLAATKYNRQPRGRSRKSPFERRWSAQPPSPPIAALRDLLQTTRRPSEGSSPFPVGSSVLYHHPDLPRAKLDPLWTPASVLQRVSEHVFRLRLPSGRPILAHRRCIRANDSSQPEPVFSVPLSELQPQQQQEQQPVPPPKLPQQPPATDSPPAPPSQPPKFDITDFRKDELIIWKDENTNRYFLGSVRAVDPSGEGRVEVQAWGSTSRMPLASRRMQPAWCPVRGRPKLLYSAQKPAGCGPELCYLIPEEVVERTALTPESHLPSDVCETYKSVLLASHDTCFPSDRLSFDSLASQAAMAVLFSPSAESAHKTEHHNAETATSPSFFLWNDEQQQASVDACSAATTHTPLPRRDLSPE
eukprot:Cvel_27478.t1-p1 / transcript=Cvel_27478.t1 / gene=Cvel_27478 / organism=Chromera_velia_CCMP2878 / gene_product=hypothetical protein / transcript_product=hypothetical protein / location=Cvel_scaffold3434:1-1427(-) / protein_length=475 / sequence_SO=supercontig / SO=protein_coding / is_pseudo=false